MSKWILSVRNVVLATMVAMCLITVFALARQSEASPSDPHLTTEWDDECGAPLVFDPNGVVVGRQVTTIRARRIEGDVCAPVVTLDTGPGSHQVIEPGLLGVLFPHDHRWILVRYVLEHQQFTQVRNDGPISHYWQAK